MPIYTPVTIRALVTICSFVVATYRPISEATKEPHCEVQRCRMSFYFLHTEYPHARSINGRFMFTVPFAGISDREVTPMFDRRKHAELPKGQAGFIQFVVLPLYEEIDAVCPSNAVVAECLARAEENLHNWNRAEKDPRWFQSLDQKQQENLQVQFALLATQKALNRRLSFRLRSNRVVSPDQCNGGADATFAISRRACDASKSAMRIGNGTRDQRASHNESAAGLSSMKVFQEPGQKHPVPPVSSSRAIIPAPGEERQENAIHLANCDALPPEGNEGNRADGISKTESQSWCSPSYSSLESKVRK